MAESGPVRELRVVLAVDDHAAAIRLYRDVLGLPVQEEFPGGTVLAAGKATIEILTRAEAERADLIEVGTTIGGRFRVAMEVADSAASGKALVSSGMKQLADPVTTPWNHVSVRLETAEGVPVTLFTPQRGAA